MEINFEVRLKKAMEFRGVSLSKLSRISGISKALLFKYLHGICVAKQDKIYKLSKALDISPAYLVGASDNMIYEEENGYVELITYDEMDKLLKSIILSKIAQLNVDKLKMLLTFIENNFPETEKE